MLEFDVSLLQIQVFLAVAEQHSFSKAAEQVNLEQSTVSRRIGVLERELGVRLFRREERPVGLTEAGELLYSRWRPLLAAFEQSVQVLERFRTTGASRLRVCTVDSLNVLNDMPEVRNALLRRQPEADLSFEYASFSQWRSKLLRDEVDVVLTIAFDAGEAETELEQEEICTCPKLVCMLRSNPLARKERVTYEDLRGQRFVGIREQETPRYAAYVREICLRQGGFMPDIAVWTSNAHGLISALQRDDEVLVCDRFLRDYANPLLRVFPLPDTWGALCAVRRRGNANPLLMAFLEELRRYYR